MASAITGGIKFFGENACLLDEGGSIVASTGTTVEDNAIDKNPQTYWTSVGSTDLITETLTLTFGSATITRLLLLDINWKQFTAKYWNGSSYVDFAAVWGMDSTTAGSAISETVFADNTAYYEFTSVTTTRLQITVLKTQTANQEKYIATVFASTELGTLQGYPVVEGMSFDKKARVMQMLSGRTKIVKSNQVFSVSLTFENYPVNSYSADVDVMLTLFDRESAFHIWLCGGRRGTSYFRYAMRGFRLKDCFRVQTDSVIGPSYTGNIYNSGINFSINFLEST